MIAHFDQIEVSWSRNFVHNVNPQISKYTTRKRVEVGNYPRALANFAKNIRPRKPYLRRALSVQQSA